MYWEEIDLNRIEKVLTQTLHIYTRVCTHTHARTLTKSLTHHGLETHQHCRCPSHHPSLPLSLHLYLSSKREIA
jgi:hypothetical protein